MHGAYSRSSQILEPLIPQLTSPPMITSFDLAPLIAQNPALAHPLIVSLLVNSHSDFRSNAASIHAYLDVLPFIPPTLPSFDLLGRLLQDPTLVIDETTGGTTTVADLIRTEVLGRFINEAINWLDHAEQEEREGQISDDRFAKGVQQVSFPDGFSSSLGDTRALLT